VYPQELDAGNLNAKYDALIFVDGASPAMRATTQGGNTNNPGFGNQGAGADTMSIPPEFRRWLGNVTQDRTVPQIKRFAEAGGMVITIGS
jgi:hypothetical protein